MAGKRLISQPIPLHPVLHPLDLLLTARHVGNVLLPLDVLDQYVDGVKLEWLGVAGEDDPVDLAGVFLRLSRQILLDRT